VEFALSYKLKRREKKGMGEFNKRLASEYASRQEEKQTEKWFSYVEQQKLAFDLSSALLIHTDMEPIEAITLSKKFVDEFYNEVVRYGAWERK
jgi:hypothetical protein